jgi:hypothetical protein
LPPKAVILLITLVARREHAEKALRNIESAETYTEEPFEKNAVSFLIATKGIKESTITSRHDILRK